MSIELNKKDDLIVKYDKHVFVCVNSRDDLKRASCSQEGHDLRIAIIQELAASSFDGINIRINKSGCLDKCRLGPVIVIYPQGFWYYNVSLSDVPEIVNKSIVEDIYIERLSK